MLHSLGGCIMSSRPFFFFSWKVTGLFFILVMLKISALLPNGCGNCLRLTYKNCRVGRKNIYLVPDQTCWAAPWLHSHRCRWETNFKLPMPGCSCHLAFHLLNKLVTKPRLAPCLAKKSEPNSLSWIRMISTLLVINTIILHLWGAESELLINRLKKYVVTVGARQ